MNKKKIFAVIITTLILGNFYSPPAFSAIRVGWAMDAMGCVPTEETAKKNIMIQVAGKVKFRDGQIGSITLICPLSSGSLTPETSHGGEFTVKQLSLTYKDGDAGAPNGLVSASLRFVNKKTGNVADLESVNSNSSGSPNSGPSGFATHGKPNLNTGAPKPGINHNLSFFKNFYYVQITLKRTSPNIPVSVMGVTLWFG
jgi:hypothetical protein